jgi:hypothetical protein
MGESWGVRGEDWSEGVSVPAGVGVSLSTNVGVSVSLSVRVGGVSV